MTELEIKTCLEGLSPSERDKFEKYLKERSEVSRVFQMSQKIETGFAVYEFSCMSVVGKNHLIKVYKWENHTYVIHYRRNTQRN